MLILTRRIGESLIIGGVDAADQRQDNAYASGNNRTQVSATGSTTVKLGDRDSVVNVKVLSVKGCQVRLGIEAPKHISVHREEIYERIQREKQPYTSTIREEREVV